MAGGRWGMPPQIISLAIFALLTVLGLLLTPFGVGYPIAFVISPYVAGYYFGRRFGGGRRRAMGWSVVIALLWSSIMLYVLILAIESFSTTGIVLWGVAEYLIVLFIYIVNILFHIFGTIVGLGV